MQTAMIRYYSDVSYRRLESEATTSRSRAMEEILTGFRAAGKGCDAIDHDFWGQSRYMEWAGYRPYQAAARLTEQHLTRVQLCPAIGAHRFEYIFPGGLSTVECDDLCQHVTDYAEPEKIDRDREWLVTSTLAGALHAGGVWLSDRAIGFARGQAVLGGTRIVMIPAVPRTTLYAAVQERGWAETVEWLRDTQVMLEQYLEEIRHDRAVWMPVNAPRPPWEPLLLQLRDGPPCSRLALGAEAAAYAGRRVELPVSAAECADWLPDREAELMAGMSHGQWRRWIESHREVRIGRPLTPEGRLAKNRRLIHRGDLRRALRLAQPQGEDICNPDECWQRCYKADNCPHRNRDCPA